MIAAATPQLKISTSSLEYMQPQLIGKVKIGSADVYQGVLILALCETPGFKEPKGERHANSDIQPACERGPVLLSPLGFILFEPGRLRTPPAV